MNNTRFATAIHIMTLLAMFPEDWLSSEYIAGSIRVNAVVVRREISVLKDAGLLESKKGKEGGCRLAKNATEIHLSEIFAAIQNSEILGKKNHSPNPECAVGKNINQHLHGLFQDVNHAVLDLLHEKTLAEFVENFK